MRSNRKMSKPAAAVAPASAPELPEWVTETPYETEYCLTMDHGTGVAEQDIDMTRDEFIELKRHLAKLRGYPLPKAPGQ